MYNLIRSREEKKKMKDFYATVTRRDRCYKKAKEFLGCGFYLRKTDGENYPEELEKFKKLFASKDPDLITAAWNGIFIPDADQIKKSDFTEEEYDFILKRIESIKRNRNKPKNPSKVLTTERLILKPNGDEKSRNLFINHLKDDGDFEAYSDHNFHKGDAFHGYDWAFKFWIYEKESGNFVGTAGVHSLDEERRCADADWYILKPYRRLGYGKEAFLSIAKKLFERKLPEYQELIKDDTFRKYYPKIDLIKAYIQEDNIPSRALAESCGFKHAYTDTRFFYLKDSKLTKNAAVYELTP